MHIPTHADQRLYKQGYDAGYNDCKNEALSISYCKGFEAGANDRQIDLTVNDDNHNERVFTANAFDR